MLSSHPGMRTPSQHAYNRAGQEATPSRIFSEQKSAGRKEVSRLL